MAIRTSDVDLLAAASAVLHCQATRAAEFYRVEAELWLAREKAR